MTSFFYSNHCYAGTNGERLFWPTRGTCSLNSDDHGLVDGGPQRREGCRRARGTQCILRGNIHMQEDTWYIKKGSAGGKKPLRREPGSPSKRRCYFRGRGYPSDICVRYPARNIVGPTQGVGAIVPNRTYHFPAAAASGLPDETTHIIPAAQQHIPTLIESPPRCVEVRTQSTKIDYL